MVASDKMTKSDREKDALKGSRCEFEAIPEIAKRIKRSSMKYDNRYDFYTTSEWTSQSSADQDYVNIFYEGWQHQQAVVDELRKLPPFIHTIIVKDGDTHWFAQALNIDYAAGGMSLDEVQRNFEKGLRGTIDANLSRFKNISRVVNPNGADIEQVLSMTDSQQRRIEELQKRVEATTTVLRELQAFLSENSGIARSKFNADADTYFDGCADAFDMVEQEVKSVLVKALRADHENK